jgi:iron complex transport system substrate-binding protein
MPRFRNVLALFLLVVFGTSLIADAPIRFTDVEGNEVSLAKPASRIAVIRSACMMPEVLAAFGSSSTLVQGLCMRFGEKDLLLKIAPGYKSLQPLFPVDGIINIEALATLKPDLAFISSDLKNAKALRDLGIATAVVNSSTKDVREIYRAAGSALGKGERAAELKAFADGIYGLISGRTASVREADKPRVLYVQSTLPLSVMGSGSYNAYMAEKAGAIYATKGIEGSFLSLSLEQVLSMKPDYVFVSPKDAQSYSDITVRPEWKALAAVKAGRVYKCPLGAFFWDKPCAESPLYALWQAGLFYPNLFPRAELESKTKEFFSRFFGYELSGRELEGIFSLD